MAKTLLDGVNEVLKGAKVIAGDSGELVSLTDSSRQNYIDTAVRLWNSAVEQLYTTVGESLPKRMSEADITLLSGKRHYQLKTDLQALYWPLHNRTNGEYIYEWQRGYQNLLISQPQPDEYTGLATFGVIRPTDGFIYLERIPTDAEAGKIFHYTYDRDVSMSVATDKFPFDDGVFRAMVDVVIELWEAGYNREVDGGIASVGFGRASRLLTRQPMRRSWLPR